MPLSLQETAIREAVQLVQKKGMPDKGLGSVKAFAPLIKDSGLDAAALQRKVERRLRLLKPGPEAPAPAAENISNGGPPVPEGEAPFQSVIRAQAGADGVLQAEGIIKGRAYLLIEASGPVQVGSPMTSTMADGVQRTVVVLEAMHVPPAALSSHAEEALPGNEAPAPSVSPETSPVLDAPAAEPSEPLP